MTVDTSQIVNLSLSLRVLVNAEALNMIGSVGTYTRHRRAPIVIGGEGGYTVMFAPAVSGEALAHAYQHLLAKIASNRNLPVTDLDLKGYFPKFSDDDIIKHHYTELLKTLNVSLGQNEKLSSKFKGREKEVEEAILKTSIVADVGGFLYTDLLLKRTSPIRFAYMVPSLDAVEKGGAILEPQLHVRYTPEARRGEQVIFEKESGSALYVLTSQLLVSDIGRTSEGKILNNAISRIDAALDTLIAMVDGILFGANRSRSMPQWSVRSLVVAVSRGPVEFIVSPGVNREYIKETYERAVSIVEAINEMKIFIYAFNREGLPEPLLSGGSSTTEVKVETEEKKGKVEYERCNVHTEAMVRAKKKAVQLVKEELKQVGS